MTLLSEVEGMLREGKPLYALNLIKQYVEERSLDELRLPKECKEIITAVRVMPWLNDESWGYFAVKPDPESIEGMAAMVSNCLGD